MRVIGILCILGAGLVLLGGEGFASRAEAKAAAAKKGSGKKKSHAVRGVVESVSPGSITVKVHHRKKKNKAANVAAGNNSARTFQIGADTQVVHNGKTVGIAGLGRGKRVVVHTRPGQVQQVASIEIVSRKNRKKA
jgi:hypothetical protein